MDVNAVPFFYYVYRLFGVFGRWLRVADSRQALCLVSMETHEALIGVELSVEDLLESADLG